MKMQKHRYTQKEIDFVLKHLRNYESYSEFCKAFNAEFGTNISRGSMSDLCIKRLKYPIKKNSTRYSVGHRDKALPIGTIRKVSGGCTYIKVSNTMSHFSGYKEPDWIPLQKKVWMDKYGPVPEGKMICFLDCNKENLDIDNLYCIDRRVSARLAQNGWWSTNPDITLAGIKYAELKEALKDGKGD